MRFGSIRRTAVLGIAGVAVAAGMAALPAASAQAAPICPTVDPVSGAVSPAPAPGVDWSGCDLAGAALAGADLDAASLAQADFYEADLSGANLQSADLTLATLNSANLTGAELTGTTLTDATLTGANLAGDDLAGRQFSELDLSGTDFEGADLEAAGFSRASLDGANLSYADLTGALLTDATLTPGTNLNDSNLTDVDAVGSGFQEAAMSYVNLTGANLYDTNLTDAVMTGDIFSNTICPNDTNSDGHVPEGCSTPLATTPPAAAPAVTAGTTGTAGWYTSPVTVAWNWTDSDLLNANDCTQTSVSSGEGPLTMTATCTDMAGNVASASFAVDVDTTKPVVTVAGVAKGRRYLYGAVPAAGCATSDAVSGVAARAAVTVTRTGTGTFTATCSGAVSVAGNLAAPVSAAYSVLYGFGGFSAPRAGSVTRSAQPITVKFRLAEADGKALAASLARSLAAQHDVRVELTGPRIKAVTATCAWHAHGGYFQCSVKVPAKAEAGKSHRYLLTALEALGHQFVTAPAVGKSANPEVIHFR